MWKIANIILIQKPGTKRNSVKDLRPIGLLPVFGKVLEKVKYKRLMWQVYNKDIIDKRQFGFMPRRSGEQLLTNITDNVKRAWHAKKQVVLLSFDMEGAFNLAWWPKIKMELKKHLINTELIGILDSYLKGRKAVINYNNHEETIDCERGCIQGSVLGPLLWNILVNGIFEISNRLVHVYAFADDITILVEGTNFDKTSSRIQRVVDKINEWAKDNKQVISHKKTAIMNMTRVKTKEYDIQLDGKPINRVKALKILGVILDTKLIWKNHVEYSLDKAARVTTRLARIAKRKWGVHLDIMLHIYKVAFEPILTYAASIWGEACSKKYIKEMLDAGQKTNLIKCLGAYRTSSLSALRALTKIPPLHLKIEQLKRKYKIIESETLKEDNSILEKPLPFREMLHPREWKHIEYTIYQGNTNSMEQHIMHYYTDESKSDKGTGAAFVTIKNNTELINTKRFYLNSQCSVYQAELFALAKATEDAIKHKRTKVALCTDSLSSIMSIINYDNFHPLAAKVRYNIVNMKNQGAQINIFWVKGHTGVLGNELADREAKEAAATNTEYFHYNKFTKAQLVINTVSLMKRKLSLEYSKYGNSWFKNFIPQVGDDDAGRSAILAIPQVICFMTGHGPFLSYLHKIGKASTSYCPCNNNTQQTPAHLLWECTILERYAEICKIRGAPFMGYVELLETRNREFAEACKVLCHAIREINKPTT